jgi:penicillin-binding protein-related factor A (putative recombinase)
MYAVFYSIPFVFYVQLFVIENRVYFVMFHDVLTYILNTDVLKIKPDIKSVRLLDYCLLELEQNCDQTSKVTEPL